MRKYILLIVTCFFISGALWGQWPSGGFLDTSSIFGNTTNSGSQVNPEEDYYLGRAVAANILALPGYRIYSANQRLTDYLNLICQTIAINTSGFTLFNGYHVVILNTMEYNAFATPGGHIMISRGLVEAAPSEDALAALIAHEMAHIILRHAAKIIDDMSLTNELADIANRAAALTGNSRAAEQALALRKSTSPIVDTMIKNGFSREQEFEADVKALQLLNDAGYDPRALVDMLQVLQNVQSSQRGGFNSTHPSPRERISNVNTALMRYSANTTKDARKARFFNK
jgi:predicted Zn-dependent protease